MSKANIMKAQQMLISSGFALPRFGADGDFGSETFSAFEKAMRELAILRAALDPDTSPAEKPSQTSSAEKAVNSQPKATRRIDEIIVHCTATPEGRDVSVATIRGWHLANGWKDIGYHWVVHLDGRIEAGRPESQVGSHVANHNTGTLGIVYVGGVDKAGKPKDTRTPAQREALMALAKALIKKYPAIKKITGHRQYANKACPSFSVENDPLGKLV